MIEIKAVGGYKEIGRNMTAVKVDDEVVIFDMGLHMPNYISFTNEDREQVVRLDEHSLRRVQAIPDDRVIDEWRSKVLAIIPSHAHLDHIGAVPYMAEKYDCPVIATPFAQAVLRRILEDNEMSLPNELIALAPGKKIKLSKKITVEFVTMTHSILETVMIAVHTPYGVVVYGNDFKLDDTPVINKKPGYKALDRIREKGVRAVIVDCLNCHHAKKTPSEQVARDLLEDVLLNKDNRGKAVIVTTFSSQLERLYSIVEFGQKLGRKIVFCGRSLAKYTTAGEEVGLVQFSDKVEIVKYGKHIRKRLREIMKEGPEKYLLVVTGHQGEPKATLSKMATHKLPWRFNPGDHVIFSSRVIPSPVNIEDRKRLDRILEKYKVTLFKDVHVSGHGGREEMKRLLEILDPEVILPSHGEQKMVNGITKLAKEMGWQERLHPMNNGDSIVL